MLIAGLTMPAMTSLMAQTKDIPTSILGEYTGVLQVTNDDFGVNETFYDITMELKESAPNYAIKSEEIDLGDGIYVPEFELDDVNITEAGNGYQLTRTGALTLHIDEIEVPGIGSFTNVNIAITLENGDIESNILTLNLVAVVTADMSGFPMSIPVNIDFEGALPTPFDCTPVTNLTAVYTEACGAALAWEAPSGNLFNIFRDDTLIKENHDQTAYTDSGFNLNEAHTWTVTVVCDGGGESAPTNVTLSDGCTPTIPCNPVTDLTVEFWITAEKTCVPELIWAAAADMPDAKYNVYKNGVIIKEAFEGTAYMDIEIEANVEYTWMVKTICADGESEGVDVTGTCDGQNINELTDNVAIYPNPANTSVTITANNFAKVEVFNTVGQLIVTTTENIVDVSSYNTGIYLFKVYDANGNSVTRRVMVVK